MNTLHIKAAHCRIQKGWMAWASTEPLTANNPIEETAEIVHFAFGATEQESVENVRREYARQTATIKLGKT